MPLNTRALNSLTHYMPKKNNHTVLKWLAALGIPAATLAGGFAVGRNNRQNILSQQHTLPQSGGSNSQSNGSDSVSKVPDLGLDSLITGSNSKLLGALDRLSSGNIPITQPIESGSTKAKGSIGSKGSNGVSKTPDTVDLLKDNTKFLGALDTLSSRILSTMPRLGSTGFSIDKGSTGSADTKGSGGSTESKGSKGSIGGTGSTRSFGSSKLTAKTEGFTGMLGSKGSTESKGSTGSTETSKKTLTITGTRPAQAYDNYVAESGTSTTTGTSGTSGSKGTNNTDIGVKKTEGVASLENDVSVQKPDPSAAEVNKKTSQPLYWKGSDGKIHQVTSDQQHHLGLNVFQGKNLKSVQNQRYWVEKSIKNLMSTKGYSRDQAEAIVSQLGRQVGQKDSTPWDFNIKLYNAAYTKSQDKNTFNFNNALGSQTLTPSADSTISSKVPSVSVSDIIAENPIKSTTQVNTILPKTTSFFTSTTAPSAPSIKIPTPKPSPSTSSTGATGGGMSAGGGLSWLDRWNQFINWKPFNWNPFTWNPFSKKSKQNAASTSNVQKATLPQTSTTVTYPDLEEIHKKIQDALKGY